MFLLWIGLAYVAGVVSAFVGLAYLDVPSQIHLRNLKAGELPMVKTGRAKSKPRRKVAVVGAKSTN